MHVLFDLMAARNVSDAYVRHFLDDPNVSEQYGLMSLIGAAGSITPTAVAARLGVAVTTASDRIRRLEEHGYAARRPNPADGRSHLVSLTDAGREAFKSTWPAWQQAMGELEAELAVPSTEIATGVRELDRAMRDILGRAGEK
jgi:DNA-binding MarR family transcriptional regulator